MGEVWTGFYFLATTLRVVARKYITLLPSGGICGSPPPSSPQHSIFFVRFASDEYPAAYYAKNLSVQ